MSLDVSDTRETWGRLLADVLAEREAAVRELAETPLEFGAYIAWSRKLMGRTDGFSPVHRVGFVQHGEPYTACGELIRGPYGWLQLSPAMVRTMEHCRNCEAEVGRVLRERAA